MGGMPSVGPVTYLGDAGDVSAEFHAVDDVESLTFRTSGTHVRFVSTIFLPGDETCLHVFEADSEADVLAVTRQAGIEVDRIVPAEQIESGKVCSSVHGSEKGGQS